MSVLLLLSCNNNNSIPLDTIQLVSEGIEIDVPKGWFYEGGSLYDKDSIRVGGLPNNEFALDANLDCKKYASKYKQSLEKSMDGYEGNFVYEKIKTFSENINGNQIQGVESIIAVYGGVNGTEKSIFRSYCVNIDANKNFKFEFYLNINGTPSIGLADSIVASAKMIQ